jgi:hypothetical protein
MSSLIKTQRASDADELPARPLAGAEVVREMAGNPNNDGSPCDCGFKGLGLNGFHYAGVPGCRYGLTRPPATLGGPADPDSREDRAPRASRDAAPPLNPGLVALAPELAAALLELDADDARVLLWAARELPRVKLRAACERATATGWCGNGKNEKNPAQRTELDGARAALLAAVRLIEPIVGVPRTARRERDEVLGDEVARRVGGGK